MIRACIFDCDGTLLDSLASLEHSGNRALGDFGFAPLSREAYREFVGDGAAMLIRRCLVRAGDEKLEKFEKVFARYLEYFSADCMYQVKPYAGIEEMLRNLKDMGILTAVCSNKPHPQTQKVIGESFENGLLDAVQGQMEGIPVKPAPDGALLVAERLKVLPGECLYIGDMVTDVLTGQRANMATAAVLWGFREREELEKSGARYLIGAPRELTDLVKQINCGSEL